jgi:uncharacterized membrane protein YkvA (DUF1232 family)|mmetsp:Transcript_82139/g.129373  ORF Transcript_82139/g.129373 Transcript_82139/m.129373 type:complete len:221 (-) Transcript_82139:253-915(-)|eukprot:CAMPEP_0169103858 /NCGR_PEP_ID=MMETSP1015-20121227/22948_1 /TAXON_ID=342587 /ORGANISM="Karlodinium micrum, Strain CCMP2283" /LENGTH=220 /DNA_ID=CAMNT_0009165101 /DNA_START=217 /DNA_END=879 /DNA_ORIENTATION=+
MPRKEIPGSDASTSPKQHHIRQLVGEQVLTVLAMALCYFFYLAMVPAVWVWGATIFTIGILYLLLPFDVFPDHWFLIGKLDDLIIGGGCMALGAYFLYEAHTVMPFPMTPKLIPPGIVSLLIVLVAYIFEDIRKTLVGLVALVGVPCAVFSVLSGNLAVGVCCLTCGFIYTMLEIDLIPDEIPIIGKFDDLVLGVLPMLAGIVLIGMHFQGASQVPGGEL